VLPATCPKTGAATKRWPAFACATVSLSASATLMLLMETWIAPLPRLPIEFTGSPQSRPWFSHCVSTLGPESARFYFAQLKEACSVHKVEERGALMTKIFQDAAKRLKKKLH
jgi:hypothetical protein